MSDILRRLMTETWPAKAAKSALEALMLPGQVAGGQLATQPSAPGMWSDVDEARSQATQQGIGNRAVDLAGLLMGGSYAAPAMKDATGMGIRAYHGSPHDFDRFDLSKIGTGEGAQVYGRGLYFAENEAVAKSYRDTLQGTGFKIPDDINALPGDQRQAILQAANAHGAQRDPLEAAKRAQWLSPDLRSTPLETIADKIVRSRPPEGRMYEVNINAKPEQFLPWDEAIAYGGKVENPELIKKIRDIMPPDRRPVLDHGIYAGLSGKNIYNDVLEANVRHKAPGVTKALAEAGIPGIKYLDQGSRGAGDGSRNYVVFDDKLVNILRKYGLGGATASPLAALMFGGSEAQAAP
jgi:predicted Rdx family selenoprotein